MGMPGVEDSGEVLQIDDKYILSMGRHAFHAHLLMSIDCGLDYLNAVRISNALSFLLDTPIVPLYPQEKKSLSAYFKGIDAVMKRKGFHWRKINWAQRIPENLNEIAETAKGCFLGDDFSRTLPLRDNKTGLVPSVSIPDTERFNTAMLAYNEALRSAFFSSCMLSNWRAIEAAEPNISKQREALSLIEKHSFAPVVGFEHKVFQSRRKVQISEKYKKMALARKKELLVIYKSEDGIMSYLWNELRHKSAHADKREILNAETDGMFAGLLKDALLLRVIARMFIEKKWCS